MLKRVKTRWWALVLGVVATAGLAVSLAVLAGGEGELIVTPYSDVIRFEAPGTASLQVQIYDLSGKLLWDSGVVSGGVVDWDRTDEYGERLAYGTYLYLVQGWSVQGDFILQKRGKLTFLPGDRVQLQQAPEPGLREEASLSLTPLSISSKGHIYLTGSPPHRIWMEDNTGTLRTCFSMEANNNLKYGGGAIPTLLFENQSGYPLLINPSGNVGVGTTSPAGKLDIRNTANQPALRIAASSGTNLIEAYNTGSGSATGLIFRVERETGNVRADGAFYGAGFYSGSADVAEHINVSEPVEPGDVVEIDPEKPGYFRKARGAFSRLVAGVISSDPGVVLGSNSDPVEGEGDSRPVLALAGRVPVKATTENGPIHVGDLLVASSKPGYAMRCTDPASAVGAVIGKALEPLEEGEGIIMVQVTLR